MIAAPVELLRDIHIVDTPGTNAVIREHEAITADFVPRSDLVLFVTSADRPFTESERQFLTAMREWGKKIVIVINKMDLFDTPARAGGGAAASSPSTRARLLGDGARDLSRQRAPGPARQARRAGGLGRQPASSALETLHS